MDNPKTAQTSGRSETRQASTRVRYADGGRSHPALVVSKLAMLTAAAALLSACASGPDYVRPASALPATFPHAAATTDATPDTARWWTQFDDPALTAIVERVLKENLDLAAVAARVEQAQAVARRVDASLLPTVTADAQVTTQHQSLESPLGKLASRSPGYQRNSTLYQLGLSASWEADLFGGLHRDREAALADVQAAAADALGVRVSLVAEAADAYFRVRGAQARIALAEAQVRTDASLSELVDLRLRQGLATRREQAQAEARLAQVRGSLPPLRMELDTQLNRLDVLMGQAPGSAARQLIHLAPARATYPDLRVMPSPDTLLRRRPDVIAAERRLAAANARIGAAISEYYPRLSLSALLGFESLDTVRPSSSNFQPLALIGLHWRLFDFGRVDAEVAQAKGATAEALARYRQAMLRATEDVEAALIAQSQLDAQRHELQQEIAATSDARESAAEAYKGGVISLLEVLEQDRQLLAARDQLSQAETCMARASVATFRALGGGW